MYALLMLGTLPSQCLKTLSRTVLEGVFPETQSVGRRDSWALLLVKRLKPIQAIPALKMMSASAPRPATYAAVVCPKVMAAKAILITPVSTAPTIRRIVAMRG